jgi:hypothetical protein
VYRALSCCPKWFYVVSGTFLHNMAFKHTDHNSMMLYRWWPWPLLHLWVHGSENCLLPSIMPSYYNSPMSAWVLQCVVRANNKPVAYEQRNCHCYATNQHIKMQHDGHLEPKEWMIGYNHHTMYTLFSYESLLDNTPGSSQCSLH